MNQQPVNKTEAFVLAVSRRSFLSLWCDSNPQGKNPSKELCDILVVCDPHVIIISVKEVHYQSDKDPNVASKRWEREAIDASVKQIYGAERWIAKATRVVRKNGLPGLRLPPLEIRRVHRIAVAIGGKGEVPIKSGDLGKGYVHVLTERGFEDQLTELDTITDLVGFLTAKEACMGAGCKTLVLGPENNLLGYYLLNHKKFPTDADVMMIDDTLWTGLTEREDYKRKKEADKISYDWDRLIELYVGPNRELLGEPEEQLTGMELALRAMARENRLSRRMLAGAMRDFVEQAMNSPLRSRTICGDSGVIYVLIFFKPTEDRDRRLAVLNDRIGLARHTIGKGNTVIGIGFVESEPGTIAVCELGYLDATGWSAEDDARAEKLKAERNFETRLMRRSMTELEYPAAE
ncbi:Uncharacterized protein OS=Smithella sp. SCADC GN=ER57_12580 PE=4 SV=1 [Gemmata massiliana]|uniref:GGDEF domain-containing protein n=1 Tax=Gemmata massiliana TaxID=1210884 RepID=A0A6P2CWB4_9BACT|nr:hypothetical protein [Gemmata massiliana]VTR93428.1 Uncharacterized protein OS=Smithella sp. SCADC GN=ER57_12580 PE=4 SV=1 [Gemmata massiliana]